MTDLVPADQIEQLVGARRHQLAHLGRAVSANRMVYILHSQACKDSGIDLRRCAYSEALDDGIDLAEWTEDQTVTLQVEHGHLTPDPAGPADVVLLPSETPVAEPLSGERVSIRDLLDAHVPEGRWYCSCGLNTSPTEDGDGSCITPEEHLSRLLDAFVAERMAVAWFEGAACRAHGDPSLTNPYIPAGARTEDFQPRFIHPRYREAE